MDICTFNDHYLNPLLEKTSKENDKKKLLIGDFNIDLIYVPIVHILKLFYQLR